jgi:hypothetical protein
MLYREIVAVCSQIHTKHLNTLCGQSVGFLYVKPGGKYSNHWVLLGQTRNLCMELYLHFPACLHFIVLSHNDKLNCARRHVALCASENVATSSDGRQ